MSEARHIALAPVLRSREVDLVLVGANDPAAMLAHTEEARGLGVPFAADPSQQLPRLDRDACRSLVDGAKFLFTNEYEWELLTRRTGWDTDEIMRRVGLRVTTLADKGCLLAAADGPEIHVDAVPAGRIVDPTGVGDAFRAGFIAGGGLPAERAAQLGSLIATLVVETAGTQEWLLDVDTGLRRLTDTYGHTARDEVEPVLCTATAPD